MGRNSKLTNQDWSIVQERILNGETAQLIAIDFGISSAAISIHLGKKVKTMKALAKKVNETDREIKKLECADRQHVYLIAARMVESK
jgi:DNA invertase Pin-like site-specific DNA recombinase